MKLRLDIICQDQFGYLVDTYEYCKHLKKDYSIRYICLDHGKDKMYVEGIDVEYVSVSNSGPIKWVQFASLAARLVRSESIVFVKYFRFCSLLRLFLGKSKPLVMDVRTGAVSFSAWSRFLFNKTLTFESKFFDCISIISESLAALLKLKNYTVLPLGAPEPLSKDKVFDKIRLLYVGTLSNRCIEDTVVGLHDFLSSNDEPVEISYDIVGDGYFDEVENLRELVSDLGLSDVVNIWGRVPYDQIKPYFERSNIGVSYIPMTSYYDVQPVTKTLEYIVSGMPVVGTNTTEQLKVINGRNGILCDDNPESFSTALMALFKILPEFDSSGVRESVSLLSWVDVSEILNRKILKGLSDNA